MSNEDGTVQAVFNGEIYNFQELRPKLEKAGHPFRSRTDTEVLVHGYEEWGLGGLLEQIRGMYAFAIVDTRRNEIHLARDPLGKKPLFFAWAKGELTFASSARALVLAQSSTPDIDLFAVDELLWNRCIGGAKTIFAGVEKLLPGHAWSLGPDQNPRTSVHWRPNFFNHEYGVERRGVAGTNRRRLANRGQAPPCSGCPDWRHVVGWRRFGTGCRHGRQSRRPDQDLLRGQRGPGRG